MSQDAFDLESKTDQQVVEAYRRSRRAALFDCSGVSLVLRCVYRGREPAAATLIAASNGKKDWIDALARASADPARRTKDGKGMAELMSPR